MNGLDLFSGIGGITLGLRNFFGDKFRVASYCENEQYCQEVLISRMREGSLPIAPIWDDIRTFEGSRFQGKVDIIYGGFPCQDISFANTSGKGLEGERSGLWWHVDRLIEEILPKYVFIENVSNLKKRGGNEVQQTLATRGYYSNSLILPASWVGAPHERKRMFILGWRAWEPVKFASECDECKICGEPWCGGCQEHYSECSYPGPHSDEDTGWSVAEENWGIVAYPDSTRRKKQRRYQSVSKEHLSTKCNSKWGAEPRVGRVDNGLPHRVDRIRALGNAVVPLQVTKAMELLWRTYDQN